MDLSHYCQNLLQTVAMAIIFSEASAPPQNPKAAPGVISTLSASLEAPGIIMQSYPLVDLSFDTPCPQHCEVENPFPKKKDLLNTRAIHIGQKQVF